MVRHLIRHDSNFKIILEGNLEGKRGRGPLRCSYIDQIKKETGCRIRRLRRWLKGKMIG